MSASAIGTDAGVRIDSAAQASFLVGGIAQPDVTSNTVSLIVDEVLDTIVTATDAGPVSVSSPAVAAVLTFNVANTGNGSEALRLVADPAVTGDNFDPTASSIFIESNGTSGLQLGAGGDSIYAAGTDDPVLAHDTSLIVYVASNIPSGQPAADIGRLALRAVAVTVFGNSGTDDPASPTFPPPGTNYVGAGDPASGGGNTDAVVGNSYKSDALLIVAQGSYEVSGALVSLNKVATQITDPFGGSTVVPGSIVRYEITATVAGSGGVQTLAVHDPLPAALAFVPGSLTVSALPPGEQADDDFAPSGTDNTGFDGANNTVVVTLGDAASGGPPVVITFDATIR
jgi:uncharacterized repeat protein (TIGR01451 family)